MDKRNIFEFLGLPKGHRPANKVVQLVKHWQEVPDSKKQYPYIGQVKKDGVFAALVVHDGRAAIFGRTGSRLSSCGAYLFSHECATYEDGIYIGELLSRNPCSLEELSGVVNPERVNPLDSLQTLIADNIYIAYHDWVSLANFDVGKSNVPYTVRHFNLTDRLHLTLASGDILQYSVIYDDDSKGLFTQCCIDAGEEGAVYKNPIASWVAGHKGFHQMKEVREVNYDLVCVGFEEGKGKYAGKVANLLFRWRDGKTIKAMLGKGYTHADAESMFSNQSMFLGKVFRVKGLIDSSKGNIRLPKAAERRFDKVEGDF